MKLHLKKNDYSLLLITVLLTCFGLLMVYDASSYSAFKDFGDKYHYLKSQVIWMGVGFTALFLFSSFDYHKLYKLAFPLLLAGIFLLLLVFVPGVGVYVLGARRWIRFGGVMIQPTECVKLILAIYLAAWFDHQKKEKLTSFLALLGIVMALVVLEPDMGTSIIILCEALLVYFLSGANLRYMGMILPMLGFVGLILVLIAPYRAARLATFLNPNASQTKSYHVHQILLSLGSGGFSGVGLGNSIQKYAYLPEDTTDSIFAIIAEEVGFVGASILIFVLMSVVWKGFGIAFKAHDDFGKLLAAGITSFLGIQMIINLGAQTASFPLTGVPLPFVSYGGSSLIVDLASIGILLNISRQSV